MEACVLEFSVWCLLSCHAGMSFGTVGLDSVCGDCSHSILECRLAHSGTVTRALLNLPDLPWHVVPCHIHRLCSFAPVQAPDACCSS